MTSMSSDTVGLGNYLRKQDFRRFLDREIRAEGYDGFRPNQTLSRALQSNPSGSTTPLTIIAQVALGQGRVSAIVGNPTTLWFFTGSETMLYFDIETFTGDLVPQGAQYNNVGLYILTGLVPGLTYNIVFGTNESQAINGAQVIGSSGNFVAQGTTLQIDRVPLPVFNVTASVTAVSPSPSTYYDFEGVAPNNTYYAEQQNGWRVIGSGFQTVDGFGNPARRWECEQVGNYLVLNNGVDLPMTYQLGDDSVMPIYELREQQIASVGTIASFNGVLICFDLWQINTDAFYNIMQPVAAAVPASQDGTGQITPSAATLFPSLNPNSLIGLGLFFSDGSQRTVTAVNGSGNLMVNNDVPLSNLAVSVENSQNYAAFTDITAMQRFQSRTLPSMAGLPRRFGAAIPVNMALNSNLVTFAYPVRSLPELVNAATDIGGFQNFLIPGAGDGAGNLNANATYCNPGVSNSMLVDQEAQWPVVTVLPNTVSLMEASDAAGSFAGVFDDLIDDGSPIIKAVPLLNQLVVFKQPSKGSKIFLGSYVGSQTQPFTFQPVTVNAMSAKLHYRNCVIEAGGGYYGSYLVYAGQNSFYKFDLFLMVPQEIPVLQQCQSIFFDNATDTENAFVAENPLTDELFFNIGSTPSPQGDTALCFDFIYNECRTTSAPFSAASELVNPQSGDDWFVLGLTNGSVMRYGLYGAQDGQPQVQHSSPVTASLAAVSTGFIIPTGNKLAVALLDSGIGHYDYATLTAVTGLSVGQQIKIVGPDTLCPWITNWVKGQISSISGNVIGFFVQDERVKNQIASGATVNSVADSATIVATASASFFTPAMVGKSMLFPDNLCVAITDYNSTTSVNVLVYTPEWQTVAPSETNQPFQLLPGIWHRNGQDYDSILETGLDPLGFSQGEKVINEWFVTLSSKSPSSMLRVDFKGGVNPSSWKWLMTGRLKKPVTANLLKPAIVQYYVGTRLTLTGMNNPIEFMSQNFNVQSVNSHSFARRQ